MSAGSALPGAGVPSAPCAESEPVAEHPVTSTSEERANTDTAALALSGVRDLEVGSDTYARVMEFSTEVYPPGPYWRAEVSLKTLSR